MDYFSAFHLWSGSTGSPSSCHLINEPGDLGVLLNFDDCFRGWPLGTVIDHPLDRPCSFLLCQILVLVGLGAATRPITAVTLIACCRPPAPSLHLSP